MSLGCKGDHHHIIITLYLVEGFVEQIVQPVSQVPQLEAISILLLRLDRDS